MKVSKLIQSNEGIPIKGKLALQTLLLNTSEQDTIVFIKDLHDFLLTKADSVRQSIETEFSELFTEA